MSAFQGRREGMRSNRARRGSGGRGLKARRCLTVEALEGRALLATLDINSSIVPTLLTYQAAPGVTNDLSISVVTGVGPVGPTRNYVFNDSGDVISLGRGAILAGWSSIDAHTVTGPSASVGSIALDTNDGP